MLSRSLVLAGLATLTLAAAPALGQPKKGFFGGAWLPSLSAGKAEAKKTGKPMMVLIRCVP